jgi:replicative DNA helicase
MTPDFDPATLPWNEMAERAVLGSMMIDPDAFDRAGPLQRRSFYDSRNGMIYAAIAVLALARKAVDPLTVLDKLGDEAHECGGLSYLNELMQGVGSTRSVDTYAELVRERAAHRALIETADEALELARGTMLLEDKLDRILGWFMKLQRQGMKKAPVLLSELVMQRVDHITALANGEIQPGWRTHIPRLTRMLSGGLRPGLTYIVAARPSIGKSSFAQDLGIALAQDGLPTLMLSMEMPDTQVADRGISRLGQVHNDAVLTGRLSNDEWGRITKACDATIDLPFYVDDTPALRLADIRAKARQVPGLKVLILDYLQLSKGNGGSNRNADLEEISRGMKELAKELGIAVIELSQLNRAVEGRADKRPMLADLRDSGAIEQDADVVLLMWLAREFEIDGLRIIGCDIAKNREGAVGAFCLGFHGPTHTWQETDHSVEVNNTGGTRL